MDREIIITSMNCQGLSNNDKRKDVLNFLKQRRYCIYCLQDTHFTEKEEKYIRSQWGFECFFNSHNSQSRGVAIFLNNNFEYKLNRIKKDTLGNKLILHINIYGKRILLINIYGPNRDSPHFYEELKQDIIDFNVEHTIIVGDFNLVLNQEKDTKNYLHINNPRAKEKVLDICIELNLVDIWRELNMEKTMYTWRKNNGNKQARLDFFLISENLFVEVGETKIETGYRSDHSMITLKLKGTSKIKGHTFWKFNNSLLKDKEYVEVVKNVISNIINQYTSNGSTLNNNNNNNNNNNTNFVIDDQLFFEVLLMEIRGKSISYATFKKKKIDKQEQNLIQDINSLQENNSDNKSIEEKQHQLQELEGLMIRSRAKWIDQGETVSKYFCNLENRNFVSKAMPNLITEDGTKTKNQVEILNETSSFYKKLYEKREVKNINLKHTLSQEDIPKLNENEANNIEGMITEEEALCSLKNMKNNKSPGSDGFTIEFFKFFWKDIGKFLVRAINYSFVKGEMSSTQKEGVIICIPKGDKDKQLLKNWRPISLLNVSYKIASSCIANRLKTVLPKLINEDQTGFIAGRYIGENIRNLYDILHYTEKNQIPGLLLLIDFEKAFDSISWTFISKVMTFFNFGESIKKWIKIFYLNIKSCVTVNGQVSKWFEISRGCRQGDPLSPYLFILCAEILALMIRKNQNIKGVKIRGIEYLISQYADDTSLTLEASERTLENTLQVLKFYAEASGLHVNLEKTKVIWFGSQKGSEIKLCRDWNLCWEKGIFTLLGVKFSLNLTEMIDLNYQEKIREIKNLLLQWSKRILTPFGNLTVVKSLAMAKINHLLLSLPNPNQNIIKELNSLFFKFIWNGSKDRIKRDVAIKEYKHGGLKMIKVESFVEAIKVTWIRRITQRETKGTKLLNSQYDNIMEFQKFGVEFLKSKLRIIDNKFWYDTFSAWIKFSNKLKLESWTHFLNQPLWHNNFVKVGGKCIFYKKWFEKGIYFINDLIDTNGDLYSYDYIENILQVETNFIEAQGLLRAIWQLKNSLNFQNTTYKLVSPIKPLQLEVLSRDKKGCQRIYRILTNNNSIPIAQRKWNTELDTQQNLNWNDVYILPYKLTKDTKLRWFQYRLIHRIISTNTFLSLIGVRDNNTCSFCNNFPETLIHLFWDCQIIKDFWRNLEEWLKSECVHICNIQLTKNDIFLQIQEKQRTDNILNLIVLLAKVYIYKAKFNNIPLTIQNFKKSLLFYYNAEKFIAYTNCKWDTFNKRWQFYKHIFI